VHTPAHARLAREFGRVHARSETPDLGFIELLAPLVTAGMTALGPKDTSSRDMLKAAKIEAATRRKELEQQEASGRIGSAQEERGKIVRYALIGLGGLVVLGGVGLFLASRKSKGKG
jgi:hypothetical protein